MDLNVLIVDDDPGITDLLQRVTEREGHVATVVNDSREVEAALSVSFDLVFLDLNMPYMDGIQVMRLFSSANLNASLVLISGFDKSVLNTAHELALAHGLNVLTHISKPFDIKVVRDLFTRVQDRETESVLHKAQKQMSGSELLLAMKENRIEMHYQPQMDMKVNRVIGIESLCRIRSHSGELIYPDNFIPEAERIGAIHDLTLLIARKVAVDVKDVLAEHRNLTVSLNISTPDLEYLNFPEVLEQIFLEQHIEARLVVVEVTESSLVQDLNTGLDILARLRLKGFKISIDDFGKGAATLEHIKHFPATEIKIDKEFIQSIGETDKAQVLVRHTLQMSHQLGLDVVAEGVEDKDIADWLMQNGCDIMQGYWFSRPLTRSALIEFLEQKQGIQDDSVFSMDDNQSTNAEQTVESYHQPVGKIQPDKQNGLLVSAILPLNGQFSFIGNSQLYGIQAALNEHNSDKRSSNKEVSLEVYDDRSEMDDYINIAQNKLSDRSIACLGGVFKLKDTNRFIKTVLGIPRVVIGPFSGSVILRHAQWKNLFNVRPSYEDELACIIDHINIKHGKTALVYPDNDIGTRVKNIVDKRASVQHFLLKSEDRTQQKLIQAINLSGAQHIIFIGASKTFLRILNKVILNPVVFYTISLVGTGSLMQSLKGCRKKVTITAPIDNYQANIPAAIQFRKYIDPLLEEDALRYRNSISYEAYLNTWVLLAGLDKSSSYDADGLISSLEGLAGVDIGLSSPVSWDAEKRQFLHQVNLLEDIAKSRMQKVE